jgi:hypothetical protein
MNLDYVRDEIARMRVQIRRQQNEIELLKRAGISTASAELLLARMRAMIFVIDERGSELSLRGKARDKLSTVQFPTHHQADAGPGDGLSRRKKYERWSGTKRCASGLFDGLGPNRGAQQWQLRS